MKTRRFVLVAFSLFGFACSAADGSGDGASPVGGSGGGGGTGGSSGAAGKGGTLGGDAGADAGASAGGAKGGSKEAGAGASAGGAKGGGGASGAGGTSSAGAGGAEAGPIVVEDDFPANQWTKMLGWSRASQPIKGEGLLQDPVRPNDLYAFYTDAQPNHRHVLKSTDYGLSWLSIQRTAVQGSPWGVAIDPNPARDPEQPPTLYTPAGYGARGLWKSTDGGVTWSDLFAACVNGVMPKPGGGTVAFPADKNSLHNDFYQVAVLTDAPPKHILLTYHEPQPGAAVLGESKDGGVTWEIHATPWGYSDYVVGVDATTWLLVSQDYGSGDGVYRTTTAGRVNGEISVDAWTKVDNAKHGHGTFTPWRDANGDLYFPSTSGIRRSTDAGATWTSAYAPQAGAVVGTEQYLYSLPDFVRATRDNTSSWKSYSTKPSDWGDGNPPFSMVVATNGSHTIIVGVNYGKGPDGPNGDIWRYKEE